MVTSLVSAWLQSYNVVGCMSGHTGTCAVCEATDRMTASAVFGSQHSEFSHICTNFILVCWQSEEHSPTGASATTCSLLCHTLLVSSNLRNFCRFDGPDDTLIVRVPLVLPSKEAAGVAGYKCPCAACPQCTSEAACRANTLVACCLDESCADKGLE
jgi:hypothetical protein